MTLNMKPLLVSGMGRTGTTITARLLDSHPAIHMTVEKRIIRTMLAYLRDLDMHSTRLGKTKPEKYSYTAETVDEWLAIRKAIAAGLRKSLECVYFKKGIQYFGDKHYSYMKEINFLPILLPNFKMVITKRDKGEIIKSLLRQHWFHGDLGKISVEIDRVNSFIEYVKDRPNIHILTLEKLRSKPKKMAKELADFLELQDKFDTKLIKGAK